MLKTHVLWTGLAVFAFAGPISAQTATMTKEAHKSAKDQIETQYKADKKACESLSGNRKDVCEDEAEGKEEVAKAELEYKYTGKPSDARKVDEARAEAAYEIAKEKCDDMAGQAKDACVAQAKATHEKAKATMAAKS